MRGSREHASVLLLPLVSHAAPATPAPALVPLDYAVQARVEFVLHLRSMIHLLGCLQQVNESLFSTRCPPPVARACGKLLCLCHLRETEPILANIVFCCSVGLGFECLSYIVASSLSPFCGWNMLIYFDVISYHSFYHKQGRANALTSFSSGIVPISSYFRDCINSIWGQNSKARCCLRGCLHWRCCRGVLHWRR